MAEDIYRNLVCNIYKDQPESVHLCSFPVCQESLIDKDLERDMREVLNIVVMGRAARNNAALKNRQPLNVMYVKAEEKLSEFYVEIIEDELNIKKVEFIDDMSEFSSYSFKPQLKTVGPRYGKFLNGIREYLANIDGNAAMNELNENGSIKFMVDGNEIVLAVDDLLIEVKQKENYYSMSERYISIAIDTHLTPELISEGYLNEVISKVQTMRKDSGFEVTDHIKVYIDKNEKIEKCIKENEAALSKVVLGDEIIYSKSTENAKEWDINGEKVFLSVEKI